VGHKVERVRGWLRAQGQSALVLRQRNNFSWITAGGCSHVSTARDAGAAAIVVTPERFVLVASNIEAERLAQEELVDVPIEVLEFPWHASDGEQRVLGQVIMDGAGACGDGTPAIAAAVAALRAPLLDSEIRRAERLGRSTAELVEAVCRGLTPNVTEDEVAARVHAAALTLGARVPVCLVAADERIATRRHPIPTGRPVRSRAMVAVCVEREGLVCSATRLVSLEPISSDWRRRHDAVCHVDATAIRATRPGRPFREIFGEIVAAYDAMGFADEWRRHHQGGSTGYQPRDVIAGPNSDATVQEQQLFAWNPTIAGSKSEDTIVARSAGGRCITPSTPGWPVVEAMIGGEVVRRPDILALA
jgi:Xaa-Pro aminopeptidase